MSKPAVKSIYDESINYAFYKTLTEPALRPTALRCIASIFFNFFFRQYRAALLPGRAPVSKVDHPLDQKIPFVPSWVAIYIDFVSFWVRIISFLLHRYGRGAFGAVRDFIFSIGRLYAFASEVYQKNFSTTDRPFYISRPRFFLIHLVDPHLMCIPSLHVMVAIRTYTQFARIMRDLGEDKALARQIEEIRQGALAISRAILYVKQHSINCISAALYAMTCFDPALFPREEAEDFAAGIFSGQRPQPQSGARPANYAVRPAAAPKTEIPLEDARAIQEHVILLYRRFLSERENAESWVEPLLNFLRTMPRC
jgi:hypothetical protein